MNWMRGGRRLEEEGEIKQYKSIPMKENVVELEYNCSEQSNKLVV